MTSYIQDLWRCKRTIFSGTANFCSFLLYIAWLLLEHTLLKGNNQMPLSSPSFPKSQKRNLKSSLRKCTKKHLLLWQVPMYQYILFNMTNNKRINTICLIHATFHEKSQAIFHILYLRDFYQFQCVPIHQVLHLPVNCLPC